MARRRSRFRSYREEFRDFLTHAQSDLGGFYEDMASRPVEFLRPLKRPYVRVRYMDTGEKTNIHFEDLRPLNELKVLALVSMTDEERRLANMPPGPETYEARDPSVEEPQEEGDSAFLK
jgi:hypothetical protein